MVFFPPDEKSYIGTERPQPKPRRKRLVRRPLVERIDDMADALDSDVSDDNLYVLRPIPVPRRPISLNPSTPIFTPEVAPLEPASSTSDVPIEVPSCPRFTKPRLG